MRKPKNFVSVQCALLGVLLLVGGWSSPAIAIDFDEYPQAREMVSQIAEKYNLDAVWVEAVIGDAVYKAEIIAAITRPAEKFPWHRYRKIFLTQGNVNQGVEFWSRYKDLLMKAQSDFGVDAEVIVAIIGVETRYGKVTGKHRVIDSLITLTLGYPKRSEFFGRELGEFLRLSHDEGLDPFMMKGSYAGAMGIPQFISSSYRNYAVDFNGNGSRDLLREPADAIGSVANYLKQHGWKLDMPLYANLNVPETVENPHTTKGLKTDTTYGSLKQAGMSVDGEMQITDEQAVGVVKLETNDEQFNYRVSFPNFYVITKYNRSPLYAMAVSELSERIYSSYTSN